MKEYTTWEVFKMLSENPNLMFSRKSGDREFMISVSDLGYFEENAKYRGQPTGLPLPNSLKFFGNTMFNERWTLVRTPVTWQEAIQAWAEGKTVQCSLSGPNIRTYNHSDLVDNLGVALLRKEILNGTWFIFDGDADE